MRAPWHLGILVALLAAGCKPDAATHDAAQAIERERIELRLAVPGIGPDRIEAEVVEPIEAALRSTPSLRHITAELGEGQLRVWLEFDAGRHDAAMSDLRARVNELQPTLPSDLSFPVLRTVDVPGYTFVRWAIESDTIDASMMGQLHEDLVDRVERVGGVLEIQSCAPTPRVVVELDPERLRAFNVDPPAVEAALRSAWSDVATLTPTVLDIDALRRTIVADTGQGTRVTLADLAAIRYGMRESTCVAASATGLVATAQVIVRDRSAAIAVEQLIDQLATRLPPGTRLRRFDPADTTIELSVDPERELAEVAESIGSGLVRLAQPWLVEVGVAAEPCVGMGTRVRVSVAGGEPVSLASFQSIPGVAHVRLLGAPNERALWLLGPDPVALLELARQEEARLRALPNLLAVDMYSEAARVELQIKPDRSALVSLGITFDEFNRQLELLRGEVEVAELSDADGLRVPVLLRVGSPEDLDPSQLGGLLIHSTRLDAIATIEEAPTAARICRRDGQHAVLFLLQAAESNAWTAPSLAAALPSGYSWSWAD